MKRPRQKMAEPIISKATEGIPQIEGKEWVIGVMKESTRLERAISYFKKYPMYAKLFATTREKYAIRE